MANSVSNKNSVKTASTSNATVKSTSTITPVDIDKENEELKKQMAEMKAQFEMMKEMMMKQSQTSVPSSDDDDSYITFVNMTNGTVGLKGTVLYTIVGQFNTRKLLKREAKLIVNNMPELIRNGAVYILDADFVKECHLDYEYGNIIDNKTMKELLNQDSSYVIEVYKNANNFQKQIIENMIVDKRLNGNPVDANTLMALGQICGKDFLGIECLKDNDDESSK